MTMVFCVHHMILNRKIDTHHSTHLKCFSYPIIPNKNDRYNRYGAILCCFPIWCTLSCWYTYVCFTVIYFLHTMTHSCLSRSMSFLKSLFPETMPSWPIMVKMYHLYTSLLLKSISSLVNINHSIWMLKGKDKNVTFADISSFVTFISRKRRP